MNPWEDLARRVPERLPCPGTAFAIEGVPETARPLVSAVLSAKSRAPVLVVLPAGAHRHAFAAELAWHLGAAGRAGDGVRVFPPLDVEPARGLSPHPGVLEERCETLWQVLEGKVRVVVTTASALLERLPRPDDFIGTLLDFRVRRDYSIPAIRAQLAAAGFSHEDPVTEKGEFSVRGGVVDIFPPGAAHPFRLDFFGDYLETVRYFDPDTQRSLGSVEAVTIPPMTLYPLRDKTAAALAPALEGFFADTPAGSRSQELADLLRQGEPFPGHEFLLPLAQRPEGFLTDYLGDAFLVLDVGARIDAALDDVFTRHARDAEAALAGGIPTLPPEANFHAPAAVLAGCGNMSRAFFRDFTEESKEEHLLLPGTPTSSFLGDFAGLARYLLATREHVLFVLSSEGRCARIHHLLDEYEIPHAWKPSFRWEDLQLGAGRGIVIATGPLDRGWRFPSLSLAVFGTHDIFPKATAPSEAPRKAPKSAFFSDFRDLKPGDAVVHLDHGVGIFRSLEKFVAAGVEQEFALLEYAEKAKVYVPVERMDLIQKYSGAEGVTPELDRLGGVAWKKNREKVKKALRDMADELIRLYARRSVAGGFPFPRDDAWMREFEDMFEHEPTGDQVRAIREIKVDMESDRPMDRLLCGDVGFGKTEVAMRAAFKAVSAGKQVAVLAPTTVLAFQHYNTFLSRFASFPFTIELLSRFRKPAQIKATVQDTSSGKVDIVIGTHRLLSKDVVFRDLGLLIVDEEQRFGVTHKERIKAMRAEVDVLTLSATPIPRTLYMTLAGIRDVSVIETPPKDRLSIQTQVLKSSDAAVEDAIRRELGREGQVYFVHNRVETIYRRAAHIQTLVPDARIRVAHGQMSEKELETVILDFMLHKFDVLVSTTIIENGLDIPLVNTLIVDKAHMFGLAQLYQLRGRVGRSSRRAYALLLVPALDALSDVSRKRLAAIRDFTELGSGFRLAALDLEIRGAGNVLGAEQHGHMLTVGFETYCRLMEEAVKEIRGEAYVAPETLDIQLQVKLRIPEDYVPHEGARLQMYKRIASLSDERDVDDLLSEMKDRYGPCPEMVGWLFEFARIKIMAQQMNIPSVHRRQDEFRIQFTPESRVDPQAIFQLIRDLPGSSFSPTGLLKAHLPCTSVSDLFRGLGGLLKTLSAEPTAHRAES